MLFKVIHCLARRILGGIFGEPCILQAQFYEHIHAHLIVAEVYQWLWKS
jgi:hypothetical protein